MRVVNVCSECSGCVVASTGSYIHVNRARHTSSVRQIRAPLDCQTDLHDFWVDCCSVPFYRYHSRDLTCAQYEALEDIRV